MWVMLELLLCNSYNKWNIKMQKNTKNSWQMQLKILKYKSVWNGGYSAVG